MFIQVRAPVVCFDYAIPAESGCTYMAKKTDSGR